jgi:hypothetical protein
MIARKTSAGFSRRRCLEMRFGQTETLKMPLKRNPLNLNPLQLKTLTLLQALAAIEGHVIRKEEDGSVLVAGIPAPHGDHFIWAMRW